MFDGEKNGDAKDDGHGNSTRYENDFFLNDSNPVNDGGRKAEGGQRRPSEGLSKK